MGATPQNGTAVIGHLRVQAFSLFHYRNRNHRDYRNKARTTARACIGSLVG
jgi:hypothetical protein